MKKGVTIGGDGPLYLQHALLTSMTFPAAAWDALEIIPEEALEVSSTIGIGVAVSLANVAAAVITTFLTDAIDSAAATTAAAASTAARGRSWRPTLVRVAIRIVRGHTGRKDINPAHRTLVGVLQHVAVHHSPLAEVGGLKPDPALPLEVGSANGVVELALLVHLPAATGRHDHDVVHVQVERVDLGPTDVPFVDLVIRERAQGDVAIIEDVVNASLRHGDIEVVLERNDGVSNVLHGRRAVGNPREDTKGVGCGVAETDLPNRPAPERDGCGALAPHGKIRARGSGEEVRGAGRLGHGGGPYAIVSDFHVLASTADGEATGATARVYDGDAEAEPPVALDTDLIGVLAVGQEPVLVGAKDLEDPLVLCPLGNVGV